jgi:hypothetical protein
MKIYTPADPIFLIRINIKQQSEKTEHITVYETTLDECYNFTLSILNQQKMMPNVRMRTTVEFREALGGENLKTISLSFHGLNPKQTKELLLKYIKG